jgi:hypothetical protein
LSELAVLPIRSQRPRRRAAAQGAAPIGHDLATLVRGAGAIYRPLAQSPADESVCDDRQASETFPRRRWYAWGVWSCDMSQGAVML